MSEKIEFSYNGVRVRGDIYRQSERDISVEITDPYQKLTNGLHIPYFAFFGDQSRKTFADDNHREKTGRGLLKQLYDIGRSIEANDVELREEYEKYKQDRQRLRLLIVLNKLIQRRLRKQFKKGELSQKEYQSKLKESRDEVKHLRFRVSKLFEVYFDDFFDVTVGVGTRDDVVRKIQDLS